MRKSADSGQEGEIRGSYIDAAASERAARSWGTYRSGLALGVELRELWPGYLGSCSTLETEG